ncbi:MAG: hypothetical protein ABEN55_09345 [Bradymonadaceae bacterium]
MKQLNVVLLALSVVSLTAACGSNNQNGNDTGSSQDTGQPEDTAQPEDTGTDTSVADTGGRDTATEDTSQKTCLSSEEDGAIPLNSFQYYEKDQGGSSTQSGVKISLSGSNPRITKIDPGNPSCDLDCADAKEVANNLLDQEIRKKMHPDKDPSWQCGSGDNTGGVTHKFKAQLGTTINAPQPLVDVTGCLAEESPPADAQTVQTIIDELMGLRKTYFEERQCHKSN